MAVSFDQERKRNMEYITLNNGARMPALGFGTFGLAADGTAPSDRTFSVSKH